MTDKQKLETGGNSIYVIPYPWRDNKSKNRKRQYQYYGNLIKWANANVFNQAICSLKIVNDKVDTTYDCLIILDKSINKNIILLDEKNNDYDIFYSDRAASAKIRYSNKLNDDLRKNFARAVACIMGVSEDAALPFNLMNEDDNDIDHIRLTFRQWNQLHAKESGR